MNQLLEPSISTLKAQYPTTQSLVKEISQDKAPPKLMVILMNLLEKMRQSRGMGWSRAWNKYGVNTFRTHKVKPDHDVEHIEDTHQLLDSITSVTGKEHNQFISDLFSDPGLMCFHFYNDREDDGIHSEGITVSLGRKVPGDASKRDRLDLVFDDNIVNLRADGQIDRVRIYVCPWDNYKEGRAYAVVDLQEIPESLRDVIQNYYERQIQSFHSWKRVPERRWAHWYTRYINYFGPRKSIPLNTNFY